jgi:squalene synthase HpnC
VNSKPDAISSASDRLDEARRHTARIARHYENFTVVSWMLPRRLRQDFYNVYAFCRHADDLADEIADADRSLSELASLREDVGRMYAGPPQNLILVALQATVRKYDIPPEPLLNLIDAFEQDRRVSRYETYAQLCDYCRRSADPVGRLVLYLAGYRDPQRQALSDCTCTALQLTNFWQDVASDLGRGRIYIPREDMARFGVQEQDILARRSTPQFVEMMKFQVQRTRELLAEGRKLLPMVHRRVRGDIALYGMGGVAILDRIAAVGYKVLETRPTLGKTAKLGLMVRYLVGV